MQIDDGHRRALSTEPEANGYRFGPFLADPIRRLLWRDGRVIPLSGKTFDVLLVLLKSRGRLIDKEELLKLVWPDAVVQENNLVRHISTLRRALGQKLDQHDLIVTVSGRGYRFVADVDAVDHVPKAVPMSSGETPQPPGRTIPETSESISAHPPPAISPGGAPRLWARVAWSQRGAIALSTALIAVLVLAILYARSLSRAQSTPRTLRQFTYETGLQQSPTWAPDGTRIAYTSDAAGNSDIWVQDLTDPTPVRLTSSSAADWQPDWSPDGRWITFRSERDGGGVFVMPAAGGDARRVAEAGYAPRWSPDSSRILFVSQSVRGPRLTAYVVDLHGGTPRRVRSDLTETLQMTSVAWSPDGRISILARDRNASQFLTAGLDGGAATTSQVSQQAATKLAGVSIDRVTWSARGDAVFLEGESQRVRNIWRVKLDARTLTWLDAERLTTGAGQDTDVAVSPDGRRLAFSARSDRARLWSFPFDNASAALTGPGEAVTPGGAGEYDVASTQDGGKLAYRTTRAERQELWEHSLGTGQDRLLLASNDWSMTSPRWSRDGTSLAYARSRRGSPDQKNAVAILAVDRGAERLVPIPRAMNFVPDDWSPDGRTILGACSDGRSRHLAVCLMPSSSPAAASQVRVIASDPARALICERFSPDQRWISFLAVDRQRGVSTVYVMPASGGSWTAVTDGAWYDDKPRWSTDGRTLLFISNRGGLLNLWARHFNPETGQSTGDAFRMTAFDDLQRMLPPNLGQIEIAVSANAVFLPVRESTGKIWILDQIDR